MIFASSKVSDGNMDFKFGDTKQVLANRQKFFQKLNINPENVAEITQVHGDKVNIIDKIPDPKTEADGLITNKSSIYLMLKIADCMAIGILDTKHQAIALIHVGWKGLEKGIIKKAVQTLSENFGSKPGDLIVKISPSIGPCCYRMDLWKQTQNQLIKAGILEKNIDNQRLCTYHTNSYFSHRKAEDQNVAEARFVTILGF